jgi:hypothetical protein
MPNITLSVDDLTYRTTRIYAAQNNTTVSGLVRQYLLSLLGQEKAAAQAEPPNSLSPQHQQLFDALDVVKHFSASDRLSREAAHER